MGNVWFLFNLAFSFFSLATAILNSPYLSLIFFFFKLILLLSWPHWLTLGSYHFWLDSCKSFLTLIWLSYSVQFIVHNPSKLIFLKCKSVLKHSSSPCIERKSKVLSLKDERSFHLRKVKRIQRWLRLANPNQKKAKYKLNASLLTGDEKCNCHLARNAC